MAQEINNKNKNIELKNHYETIAGYWTIAMVVGVCLFLIFFASFKSGSTGNIPLNDPMFSVSVQAGSTGGSKFYLAVIGTALFGFGNYFRKDYRDKANALTSGLQGEKIVSNKLSQLGEEYKIINNVPLENDGRKTELDSLIVSPYGLWIVEVKNYKGSITGNPDDVQWVQGKYSKSGQYYESNMRNPIKQMHFQKYLLSTILKNEDIYVPIKGFVVFPSAQSVQVNSDEVFMSMDEIFSKVKMFKEVKIKSDVMNKIISLFNLNKEHVTQTYGNETKASVNTSNLKKTNMANGNDLFAGLERQLQEQKEKAIQEQMTNQSMINQQIQQDILNQEMINQQINQNMMDQQIQQIHQNMMDQQIQDSMTFSMNQVIPFEHGGMNIDQGNSFNNFGSGGFGM